MAWTADAPTANPYNQAASGTGTVTNWTGTIDLTHTSVPSGWPQSIFQSERYKSTSEHSWVFPVDSTSATYRVRVGLCENWSGITGTGQRIFDVIVNGTTIASNIDLYALVGQHKAYVLSHTLTAPTGQITITTLSRTQNALINAIEVDKVTGNNAPVISGASYSVSYDLPSGSLVGTISASDPDGDNLTWSKTGTGPFALSQSGQLTTTSTLAASTTYTLTVTVTDNGSPNLASSATVTVTTSAVPPVEPPPPAETSVPASETWPTIPPQILDPETINELRRLTDLLARQSMSAVGDIDAKLAELESRIQELGG